jgi:hypothetical protein
MDWSFFQGVRCINLKERNDRYESSYKVFEKIGLSSLVRYHRVDRHPSDPIEGCFNSHMSIIREAYDNGNDNVLIFEDDILQTEYLNNTNLSECIKFMKENEDWEIFFLGCIPDTVKYNITSISGYSNIYKVRPWGCHAYVVNRKYMEKIYSMKYIGHAIDGLTNANKHAYCIIPSLFEQGSYGSDINTSGSFGNVSETIKRKALHINELYATMINKPLVYLLVILSLGFGLMIILYLINPKQGIGWLSLLILIIGLFLII